MSALTEPPAAPTATVLREAAVRHLARFASTEHGLAQVLERRLRRWGQGAERAGMTAEAVEETIRGLHPLVQSIVADMTRLGAVDDAAFARSRSLGLTRTGRSRRAVAAHLAGKGVGAEKVADALAETLGERYDDTAQEAELGAALVLARKRRFGPFRRPDVEPPDPAAYQKMLAVFARAGFGRNIAELALSLGHQEAEERVLALKSL